MNLLNLDMENIHSQLDDEGIKNAEAVIQKIADTKAWNDKDEFKKYLKELSEVLTDRFGFTIHVNNTTTGAFMIPVLPDIASVIDTDSKDAYAHYAKLTEVIAKEGSLTDEKMKTMFLELDDEDVGEVLVTRMTNNANMLMKTLNTKGVVIDLKNARIENLPKEFIINIFINFESYAVLNGGSSVTMAITLHEIGHAFTGLSYYYATALQNIFLAEGLKYAGKKTSNLVGLIKLTNSKLGIKTEDTNNAGVMLANLFTDIRTLDTVDSKGHSLVIKESEMAADRFAARFGYGAHLVSGLVEMSDILPISGVSTFAASSASLLPTKGFSLLGILVVASGVALFAGLIRVMAGVGLSVYSETENATGIYGSDERRFTAIRNDIVRQLRTTDLDKKTAKRIVAEIEYINAVTKTLRASEYGIAQLLIKYVTGSDEYRERHMQDLLTGLQENNLHVTAAKFDELMSKRV